MKVLSFGSLNLDHVYAVPHIIRPGETISARGKELYCGGKGLNQSIAAARAGLSVCHAGGIGESEGDELLEILSSNGVDVSLVERRPGPAGHTIIQVDPEGHNSIIVFGGSNQANTDAYIHSVLDRFQAGDYVILQNEINGNAEIIRLAREKGMKVVLNPSPFDESAAALCPDADFLFVNETEAQGLTGTAAPEEQLSALHARFPRAIAVLTLGEHGSRCAEPGGKTYIQEAYLRPAADTTAAGDTFTGYFLALYAETGDIPTALRAAAMASSIAVSRPGAAPSIPRRDEVDAALAAL